MRISGIRPIAVLLLALIVPGCQLPGRWWGPVSPSVANCRQLTRQGIAAIERGQARQAEELLAGAVKTCPADYEARRHYAETLWLRGAYPEAIAQLKEASRLVGEDAPLRVRLAEMQLAVGRNQDAGGNADRALDINPESAAAWAIRGRVMRTEGQLRQALADYHHSLSYDSNNTQVLLEVAELQRALNQPERALATLYHLADIYPPDEEPQHVLYLIGLAHVALQRYEDGAAAFTAAIHREKPTPEIYYRLAEAEMLAGHLDTATAAADLALVLEPAHQPTRELLGKIRVARQPQPTELR